MITYIQNEDFLRTSVRQNTRIRKGFIDLSHAVENRDTRESIVYHISKSWNRPETREHPYHIPKPDKIAGKEGVGITVAALVAHSMNIPLIVVRDKYQLAPFNGDNDIISKTYINYRKKKRTVELRKSSVLSGFTMRQKPRVLIVDDLLKTGRTAMATAKALREAGAEVVGLYVVAVVEETAKTRLRRENIPVEYLVSISTEKLITGMYQVDACSL